MDKSLYCHVVRTARMARKLASLHGQDKRQAYLAGLIHDIGKTLSMDEQVAMLQDHGYGENYLKHRAILHAPCGRILAKKEYGISDFDVLLAVEYHTCGKENMSSLQKILYVADAVETGRQYPGVKELRREAYADLDRTVFRCLEMTVKHLRDQGKPVFADTLAAQQFYARGKIDTR